MKRLLLLGVFMLLLAGCNNNEANEDMRDIVDDADRGVEDMVDDTERGVDNIEGDINNNNNDAANDGVDLNKNHEGQHSNGDNSEIIEDDVINGNPNGDGLIEDNRKDKDQVKQ